MPECSSADSVCKCAYMHETKGKPATGPHGTEIVSVSRHPAARPAVASISARALQAGSRERQQGQHAWAPAAAGGAAQQGSQQTALDECCRASAAQVLVRSTACNSVVAIVHLHAWLLVVLKALHSRLPELHNALSGALPTCSMMACRPLKQACGHTTEPFSGASRSVCATSAGPSKR
jgi:hypothetical protein